MPRRKTTIGVGPFGQPRPVDSHALEVLRRIVAGGHPLTEDAVFLCLYNLLRQRGSRIFQNVRTSTNLGGYRYFQFSPDIDLLEVRRDRTVVGYELKGYIRKARSVAAPLFYEGVGQALAYLLNPVSSPWSQV